MGVSTANAYEPTQEQIDFGKRIAASWQAALSSILETAAILKEASDKLGRKAWLDMVSNECPFGRRTAEKLVKIADDIRICDPDNAEFLPPYWTSLHQMTFLTDDEFEEGISIGIIRPDVERKEIEQFVQVCRMARNSEAEAEGDEAANEDDSDENASEFFGADGDNWEDGSGETGDGQASADDQPADIAVTWVQSPRTIAMIEAEQPLSPWQIDFVEKALAVVSNRFPDLKLKSSFPKPKPTKEMEEARLALANELRTWLKERTDRYRGNVDEHQRALIEDAFFQMDREKNFISDNGELPLNDIRNPKNPFHGWSRGELFKYCKTNKIVTRYTPIQRLDYQAYLRALVFRHCIANDRGKDLAHLSLWRRSRSKNEKRAKLAKAALDMLVL